MSTIEKLVVVRRSVVGGSEKAKLADILFCCLVKYPEGDGSVKAFGAADVVKATQRLSVAG